MYEIHISEHPSRDGMFLAASRIGTVSVKSRDPEHEICDKLMKMGYADGPVQFWRGNVPSLSHPSMHAMGRRRIALGVTFPYRRPRRGESPESWEAIRQEPR